MGSRSGRTTPFAAARGDKTAMRPFVKILWSLVTRTWTFTVLYCICIIWQSVDSLKHHARLWLGILHFAARQTEAKMRDVVSPDITRLSIVCKVILKLVTYLGPVLGGTEVALHIALANFDNDRPDGRHQRRFTMDRQWPINNVAAHDNMALVSKLSQSKQKNYSIGGRAVPQLKVLERNFYHATLC